LRTNALPLMQDTIGLYERVAPGWFVSKYEATRNEGTHDTLYNVRALFTAKAWIQQASQAELIKYLDVAAFARGDMFYIANLATALAAT